VKGKFDEAFQCVIGAGEVGNTVVSCCLDVASNVAKGIKVGMGQGFSAELSKLFTIVDIT
jgi:hypothetical protein